MSEMGCNLCGARELAWSRQVYDYADPSATFRLVKCGRCGLVYLDPLPAEAELLARSPGYQAMIQHMMQDLLHSRVGRLGLRLMKESRTPPTARRGCALDIGCSWGDYLVRLRDLGWEVRGIEMDEQAARHVRDAHGIAVLAGRAEERLRDVADDSIDLVTMWHVLEHVSDPALVLKEVRRVLKPGGMLLLEVPNVASAWARLLGREWYPLEPPYHLYHFSPRTLRRMLGESGLRVSWVRGEPEPTQTIWSAHMLWHRLRGTRWNGRLPWSPTGVVLLYPVELLLACLGYGNHMRAVAVK